MTGGSGMIGKSLKTIRPEWTYVSSTDYDLTNEAEVQRMFDDIRPQTVIHLAAKVGGIMDNIMYPADYFDRNILINTLVLRNSYLNKVERFIGILSTCIYPDEIDTYPITENMIHLGPPTTTNFSYAYAKRSLAVQIEAYNKQYGTNYQYLIPCNLYGEHDKYGENSHFVAALIKKIHNVGDDKIVTLFGTGTPLRQFMYAYDLANVIVKCIDENIYTNMNVATKENLSIRQIAEVARLTMNPDVKLVFDPSKPDGQFRKDVSTDLLEKVMPDWNPVGLAEGIRKTYAYLLENKLL